MIEPWRKYGGDPSSADSPFRASPDPGEIAAQPVISHPHRNASVPNPVNGSSVQLERVMDYKAAGCNIDEGVAPEACERSEAGSVRVEMGGERSGTMKHDGRTMRYEHLLAVMIVSD